MNFVNKLLKWNNQYNAPDYKKQDLLTKLPFEILEIIASKLDSKRDLKNLAFTCKTMSAVVLDYEIHLEKFTNIKDIVLFLNKNIDNNTEIKKLQETIYSSIEDDCGKIKSPINTVILLKNVWEQKIKLIEALKTLFQQKEHLTNLYKIQSKNPQRVEYFSKIWKEAEINSVIGLLDSEDKWETLTSFCFEKLKENDNRGALKIAKLIPNKDHLAFEMSCKGYYDMAVEVTLMITTEEIKNHRLEQISGLIIYRNFFNKDFDITNVYKSIDIVSLINQIETRKNAFREIERYCENPKVKDIVKVDYALSWKFTTLQNIAIRLEKLLTKKSHGQHRCQLKAVINCKKQKINYVEKLKNPLQKDWAKKDLEKVAKLQNDIINILKSLEKETLLVLGDLFIKIPNYKNLSILEKCDSENKLFIEIYGEALLHFAKTIPDEKEMGEVLAKSVLFLTRHRNTAKAIEAAKTVSDKQQKVGVAINIVNSLDYSIDNIVNVVRSILKDDSIEILVQVAKEVSVRKNDERFLVLFSLKALIYDFDVNKANKIAETIIDEIIKQRTFENLSDLSRSIQFFNSSNEPVKRDILDDCYRKIFLTNAPNANIRK